jgi:hypothetical protein
LNSLEGRHPHGRRKHKKTGGGGAGSVVCRLPKSSLHDDENKDAYHRMPPLKCPGEDLFFVRNAQLHVNDTVLAGRNTKRCEYRSISWDGDHSHTYSKVYARDHAPFEFTVKHDFFRVQCYLNSKRKSSPKAENEVNAGAARRRLLQRDENEEEDEGAIASVNSPNLVGSFGLPDIGHNVLKNHAQQLVPTQTTPLKAAMPMQVEAVQQPVLPQEKEVEESPEAQQDGGEDVNNLEDQHGDAFDHDFDSQPNPPDFDQFIAQIYMKDETQDRLQEIVPSKHSMGMDVLIFALDSMSHMSYQRKLPKTYAYLQEVLDSTIMNGYNIVGDATTAALLPILTG